MVTQREAVFRKIDALLAARACEVVLLGPAARTWRYDIGQIEEIVEYLVARNAIIRIAGKLPFDGHVETVACALDANIQFCGPTILEERLKYTTRNPWILESTDLIVAFPLPKTEVTTADALVEEAIAMEIPVLALYRDESVRLVVGSADYLYG
jgi:hypothetical protein